MRRRKVFGAPNASVMASAKPRPMPNPISDASDGASELFADRPTDSRPANCLPGVDASSFAPCAFILYHVVRVFRENRNGQISFGVTAATDSCGSLVLLFYYVLPRSSSGYPPGAYLLPSDAPPSVPSAVLVTLSSTLAATPAGVLL